tara:strand:+ start:1103 stop:1618 length:516 start_codon:yes stop_codon:yes gene_type:complete
MKFFFKLLVSFFLLIGILQAEENIRFININYVVNNSDAGISLNKIIENKTKKIESDLKVLAKKIKDKKDKIISQKNILKEEEFNKLVKNYENEVKVFNELKNKKQADFDKFRINSKKKILDLLNPIITDFLQNNSIKILLQKEKIIFGDDNLDITEKILKIFNDKHKKIKF